MNKKWTIIAEKFLEENVTKYTDEQLATVLTDLLGWEVTMLAVRKKRQKMGLKKARGRGYCKLDNNTFYKNLPT